MMQSSQIIESYRQKYLANKVNPLKSSKKSMFKSFISNVKEFDKSGKRMNLSQFGSTSNKAIYIGQIEETKARMIEEEVINYICDIFYDMEVKGSLIKRSKKDFKKSIKEVVDYVFSLQKRNIKNNITKNDVKIVMPKFKININILNELIKRVKSRLVQLQLIDNYRTFIEQSVQDIIEKISNMYYFKEVEKKMFKMKRLDFDKEIKSMVHYKILLRLNPQLTYTRTFKVDKKIVNQIFNSIDQEFDAIQLIEFINKGQQPQPSTIPQTIPQTNLLSQMGQQPQLSQLGQMGNLGALQGQMGQMGNLGALQGQMGQSGDVTEASDKIKQLEGFVKIFDIFKPENLNNMIAKLRLINPSKFDAIEELKGLDKKKKFELVKLKYVAKFVNSLEENDINKFIKSLSSSLPLAEGGTSNPLESMGLSNSMGLDMYTIKDVTSIFIDINDEMYNLIQDFVNDQVKFVKKAQNQGDFTEAIDVRLIPKLLNILDQLSISNLDKIINLATTKFGVAIPIRGFQIKLLVKSLRIIFPLKNQAKLTNNIKNEMRSFVIFNDLSNENKGAINQFKRKLKEKEVINLLSVSLLKNNQISNNLKNNKNICLLLILLINSFYLTHNIKLFDIDKIKSIYGAQRKVSPNISIEEIKKKLKSQIISIYRRFIYTKGLIILLSKYALDYYSNPKYNNRFYNILFHIVYSFNQSNSALNIYHQDFDYKLYLKSIQSDAFKSQIASYNLEENVTNLYKLILDNADDLGAATLRTEGSSKVELKLEDITYNIYKTVFKNKKYKNSILKLNAEIPKFRTANVSNNQHKYEGFINFFNKIMKKKYVAYISDHNQDVSKLRLNKSVNITQPIYFSLHELKLSDYNRVNKFILRANLNVTNELSKSNEENEENENNNQARVKYTKEELNKLTKLIKKKMYNNSELNKLIRNKNNSIYNSSKLIEKMKDLYTFEAFILIIFKGYYKNIFNLLTQYLDPLAKDALTKV